MERQQANLVAELQTHEPTGDDAIDQQWRTHLRTRFAALGNQIKAARAELAALADRAVLSRGDQSLLDQLPVMEVDLADLPEALQRELFDAFQLQIRYHHPTRRVTSA